jgi:hypothetical protein
VILKTDLAEVWLANCLDESDVDRVMQGRKADALVFDAPYSARTHLGHDSQHNICAPGEPADNRKRVALGLDPSRRLIDYRPWGAPEIGSFCSLWLPRCAGWVVTITDNTLAPEWASAFEASGLYAFAPLPLVETGSRVRMSGDGPSSWTCWVVVARPRGSEFVKWGTLPGAYVVPRQMSSDGRIVGGKPLLAMQCIVRDYSRRGDLVVDPTCGGGTTGRAAIAQGRRFIGIEQDAGRAEIAKRQLERVNVNQIELFEEAH